MMKKHKSQACKQDEYQPTACITSHAFVIGQPVEWVLAAVTLWEFAPKSLTVSEFSRRLWFCHQNWTPAAGGCECPTVWTLFECLKVICRHSLSSSSFTIWALSIIYQQSVRWRSKQGLLPPWLMIMSLSWWVLFYLWVPPPSPAALRVCVPQHPCE